MSVAVPTTGKNLNALGRTVLLELAYEEYLDQAEAGQPPEVADFCANFPGLEESLANLLDLHHRLKFLDEPSSRSWPVELPAIPEFEIVRSVAGGSLSRVFLARDRQAAMRPVVLKLSRLGNEETYVQSSLGRLQHRNIAGFLYSRQMEEGWTLAVMPFQGDLTLESFLQQWAGQGPPANVLQSALQASAASWSDVTGAEAPEVPRIGSFRNWVLACAEQLADALQVIHREYSHGDIKPAKVLLPPRGCPLLRVFTLSRRTSGTTVRPGGTLLYMAPELLGALAVRPGTSLPADQLLDYCRADQFAFGVMFIQLLTGRHPYALASDGGKTVLELVGELQARLRTPAARTWEQARVLDGGLRELLRRCVAADPAERWPDFAAIRNELRDRRSRQTRARRFFAAAGVATALAVATGWPLVANLAKEQVTPALVQRALDQGRFDQALEAATQLVIAAPEDPEVRFLRVLALEGKQQYSAAIADLSLSLQWKPMAERYALLAYYYGLPPTRQPDSARVYAERARDLGCTSAANLANLGYAYLATASPTSAKATLDLAISMDLHLAMAYRNRAKCFFDRLMNSPTKDFPDYPLAERIADICRALESLSSGDIHADAASIFAHAARTDETWGPRALEQLRLALSQGCDPARFRKEPAFMPLRALPGFEAILDTPAAPNAISFLPRVVHPLRPY